MKKPIFFRNMPAITKSKGFVSFIILALVIANIFIPHFTAGILIVSILSILFKTGYFIFNSLFNEENEIEINRLANISILILLIGNILHFLGPEVHLLTGKALIVSSIAPVLACSLSLIIYTAIAFIHSKNNKDSYFKIFNIKIKHRYLAYFMISIICLNILFISLSLTVFPSIIITLHTPIVIATTFISLALPIYSIYNAINEFLNKQEVSSICTILKPEKPKNLEKQTILETTTALDKKLPDENILTNSSTNTPN